VGTPELLALCFVATQKIRGPYRIAYAHKQNQDGCRAKEKVVFLGGMVMLFN
jgi:hypothetical protein